MLKTIWLCVCCNAQHEKWVPECWCGNIGKIICVEPGFAKKIGEKKRIKSAAMLRNQPRTCKLFPGFEFLGTVPDQYMMNVYGEPGSGKSTFCILFADALATQIGPTLYVSGEEGHGEQFITKLALLDIDNDRLFVSELEDSLAESEHDAFEFVKKDILQIRPKCVVIDSIGELRFSLGQIKTIYKMIKGPIVCILHITKDGQYKGGTDIAHKCDIHVRVDNNGIAKTEKNRYGQKEQTFDIFAHIKKEKSFLSRDDNLDDFEESTGVICH